jgi:hypothetical protein
MGLSRVPRMFSKESVMYVESAYGMISWVGVDPVYRKRGLAGPYYEKMLLG